MQPETYTTQPTTDLFLEEPVVYAGFWQRFGAYFIDALILIIPQLAISYMMPGLMGSLISMVFNWVYFAGMESGKSQATFGKKALGLKVTDENGQRITFGQATGRFFGKILSAIILFIGYLMMIWDAKKQTLHDKLVGTLVVER